MNTNKILKINGTLLDKNQLERHLEKVAANHNIVAKSKKETYPVPQLLQSFEFIKETYNLLNEHVKLGITIHPAGEWLLDNFYIIEEIVKQIQKELTVKKYTNFLGIANGQDEGFARIYVLASEIVSYTEGKIEREDLENYISAYQTKRTLNMDEIWNIGLFLQIAIVNKIKDVCEKIYSSQLQKYKVEEIVERLIDNKSRAEQKYKSQFKYKNQLQYINQSQKGNNYIIKIPKLTIKKAFKDMRYPFIEYMAYILKRYGKKGYSYLKVLEETVEMAGSDITDIIKKEHFDIALKKVLMGNYITSIKTIQRIDFLAVFQKLNGVEELLKQDPAKVYSKMDHSTKAYYRNIIKEIATKSKISEIYIAKKILELAGRERQEKNNKIEQDESQKSEKEKINEIKECNKKSHIGYYLVDEGINELYKKINYKSKKTKTSKEKAKVYIFAVAFFSALLSTVFTAIQGLNNVYLNIISFVLLLIPSSEIVIQTIQFVLSKIVKPKLIPKIDFSKGIDEENSTIVVIPTILKNKQKVQELMRKLEVFYIANKSDNLYFALLGDCSECSKKEEDFDNEVIEEGIKQCEYLNEKYKKQAEPIFHFLYRERTWNPQEEKYLGWERKRGLLNQFNEYMLGNIPNVFRANTMEAIQDFRDVSQNLEKKDLGTRPQNLTFEKCHQKHLNQIKYVITLDADTDLVLGSAFELVGVMAHILNKPIIDKEKNIVTEGYGIIQPRVGVNLDISYKNLFTKIFAGSGGIDSYTNAISDTYQDNFGEGIFTGKGIYDLQTFSKVMENAIPENTVLSHDLLEGNYLRCGLASDIMLMDGYPTSYLSFMTRLTRWIRGDWQIARWLAKRFKTKEAKESEISKNPTKIENKKINNPLNLISKYKIFDNLRRSMLEISVIIAFVYVSIINLVLNINSLAVQVFLGITVIFPFLLELLNIAIGKKEGEKHIKDFSPKISGVEGAIYRLFLTFGCLPFKAYCSVKAICKTMYRCLISKKHLLEWTTSEEAEKQTKQDLFSYYKQMSINVVFAVLFFLVYKSALPFAFIWAFTPFLMYYISRNKKELKSLELLNKDQQNYMLDIAKRTWSFFEDNLTKENNYLITDNYQEDRKEKIVERTSSTNIGLSLMAVISAYDLNLIDLEKCLFYLEQIIKTVDNLEKWNGHLYNWYNTKALTPLNPRYVSTVDSGNFVGYLYVVKSFLESEFSDSSQKDFRDASKNLAKKVLGTRPQNLSQNLLKKVVNSLIENTDFSKLYSKEHNIFSIGFNIEDNKLTDSYYDLLATEARQASFVAIAKKDVPSKHWNMLSRTITTLKKYSGLISWSGTAFEYLMPNINIPKYEGSLLDESCKFMIMSQMEYAKKLNMPWGISEAAFNLKDLHGNYQYKAFGIPWLGLKRGLADEFVVSSYGSILAINDAPIEVVKNLQLLEQFNMKGKYGFYESIDFTPERAPKNQKASVVKTYMAHHQGLILLSINNLFNNNILQERFMQNPEMEAASILLQERKPDKFIITKEDKEKIEKLKYTDYEDYVTNIFTKIDERLITGNVISNENYTVAINQKGVGFSKFNNIYINRFKPTEEVAQGIFFYIKNIKTKEILTTNYTQNNVDLPNDSPNSYEISFSPDKTETKIGNGRIKAKVTTTLDSNYPVEIRRLYLENNSNEEETLEISSFFEPVLSTKEQDYAHQTFNNLFLVYEYDKQTNSIVIKRKTRNKEEVPTYLATTMYIQDDSSDLEYEIDKEKFIGRGNYSIPNMIQKSLPFSNKLGLTTDPVVALKRTIKLKPSQKINVNLVISVENSKEKCLSNLQEFSIEENVNKTLELSKARVEAESRYLRIKGKDITIFQKMISYILFKNPINNKNIQSFNQSNLWKYGISGDLPIILVKIRNASEGYVVKEILKAYEFFKSKNIEIELVILDEEKHSYENYVREEIENCILNNHMGYLKNIKGGIFELSSNEIDKKDIDLLNYVAKIVIDSKFGGLENNIKEIEDKYLEEYKDVTNEIINISVDFEEKDDINLLQNTENLLYYNEYGGFSEDGKEYLITVNKEKRLPTVWCNILANEKFGTVVTDSMGGYTWYKNSRLNRVTAWENNACYDIPSEAIFIKNLENNKTWSLGLNPKPDDNNYNIINGFGYTKYIHKSQGIEQELTVFVPKEDSAKVEILKLKNTTPNKKQFKIYYYIKPVLGEDEYKTNRYINLEFDKNNNLILLNNNYNSEIKNSKVYLSCSEKILSYTGDKEFFFGKGGINNPEGLKKQNLNNVNSLGLNACAVYEFNVDIESYGEKEISIVLGAEENNIDCKNIAYKYSKVEKCKEELNIIKKYWEDLLRKMSSKNSIRFYEYYFKWMGFISNNNQQIICQNRILSIWWSSWL